MKPKTKAFADKLLSDPKISHTNAYLATHETTNRNAAKVEASKLLTKPNVRIYLRKHAGRARDRVVELVDSHKQDIALKASIEILDRTYGKSIQRQETSNTNLNLNIEANMALSEDFTAFLKQKTVQRPTDSE